MKIINLTQDSQIYTCNAYLVLGTWNGLSDVNTLIDVGRDPAIIDKIFHISTGVGKKKVDQVILTHGHYDHTSLLPRIREVFNPVVYAFSPAIGPVDVLLKDGDQIRIGDRDFEVFHTPGHSSDSICLFCQEESVLFVGDTPVFIRSSGNTYSPEFIHALTKLSKRTIQTIYCGHGDPLFGNCNRLIKQTIENVQPVHFSEKLIWGT